jgi:hypothetical protein
VTCNLGTIAAKSQATVMLTVAIARTGTATNTATATNAEGSTANGTASTDVMAAAVGTAPKATTSSASSVTRTGARLTGHVDNGNQRTGYFFEVGRNTSYGMTTPVQYVSAPSDVSAMVAKLQPGTTYHFRLVAVNDTAASYGQDRTFRTSGTSGGSLVLDGRTLRVAGRRLYAKFTCASDTRCVFRFSIGVHAKVGKSHRTATILFLQSKTTLKTLRPRATETVTASVTKAGLALLKHARGHRLSGKLTTRPRTAQKGIVERITIVGG